MANELNEIQTGSRRIHPETTLFWFTFFWITIGWRWWSQATPNFDVVDYPLEPENLFLKFFICASLFMLIAGGQFLICHLFWIFVQDSGGDLSAFSQLCSISNCSVLIFDQKFHGYYIHGKAQWEKSDLPLMWLYRNIANEQNLASEGKNTRSFGQDGNRLLPRNNSCNFSTQTEQITTYEIYMQPWFREQIDNNWAFKDQKKQLDK